jgi:hypothetical protein
VALADAMTLVNAVIAGPVLAAVVLRHSSPRSRAEGGGCSAANEARRHEGRSSRHARSARRCRRTNVASLGTKHYVDGTCEWGFFCPSAVILLADLCFPPSQIV